MSSKIVEWCLTALTVVALCALAGALFAVPVWLVWNYVAVPLAGVGTMTPPMAWAVGILIEALRGPVQTAGKQ